MPAQPPAVGVTVMVAVIGAPVEFVPLKAAMFPEPLAARPMAVLELVQLKVVPATPLLNAVPAILSPLQMVMLAGTVTLGVGFTVMV